jgi:uncharacterized protein (DUF58 family)
LIGRRIAAYFGKPRPQAPSRDVGAELRAQVRRLEIRARQAMESGLAGEYQSAFRGLGLEFEEVREYRAGDDIRTIDWNVTARSGFLHVKRYREERDLNVLLLVDLSSSTRFGSGVMTVHDLIAEVGGLFALAAARRDRVGAILFDDDVRKVIPPRLGWRHGLRVVREILAAEPAGRATALADAIRAAGRMLRRRGVVIILVDQSCPLPRRELVALAGRHEVVVVRLCDAMLEEGVSNAALPVVDVESGSRGVVRGRGAVTPQAPPPRVDLIELHTGEDYLPAVRSMLERRERRRAH